MKVADWNPCATCNCRGTCYATCCRQHDDMGPGCLPGALCCSNCPEQFHPEHPEGIDCNRRED